MNNETKNHVMTSNAGPSLRMRRQQREEEVIAGEQSDCDLSSGVCPLAEQYGRPSRKRCRNGYSDGRICTACHHRGSDHSSESYGKGAFDQSRRQLDVLVRPRSEDGNSVLEVVIIVPVLMVIILLTIQAALWAYAEGVVQQSASIATSSAAGIGGSVRSGDALGESYLSSNRSALSGRYSLQVSRVSDVIDTRVTGSAVAILPLFDLAVSAQRSEVVQEFRGSE